MMKKFFTIALVLFLPFQSSFSRSMLQRGKEAVLEKYKAFFKQKSPSQIKAYLQQPETEACRISGNCSFWQRHKIKAAIAALIAAVGLTAAYLFLGRKKKSEMREEGFQNFIRTISNDPQKESAKTQQDEDKTFKALIASQRSSIKSGESGRKTEKLDSRIIEAYKSALGILNEAGKVVSQTDSVSVKTLFEGLKKTYDEMLKQKPNAKTVKSDLKHMGNTLALIKKLAQQAAPTESNIMKIESQHPSESFVEEVSVTKSPGEEMQEQELLDYFQQEEGVEKQESKKQQDDFESFMAYL